MNKMRKNKNKFLPVLIWDTIWKLIAIRRAVQLRKYKMIPVLALANTAGIMPITFLWKNRGKSAEAGHSEEMAPA